MKKREFRIDDPQLMDVLEDDDAAELLLCMQVHGRPITLKALSELASRPTTQVGRTIDMLRAVGLATAVRAGGGQRAVRYMAAPPPLKVYFEGTDATQSQRVARFTQRMRARLTAKIDAAGVVESVGFGEWSSECLYLPLLSAEEMRELRNRFLKVFAFLKVLEQRRWSQRIADPKAGKPTMAALQHAVEVRVRPLRAPVLPELEIEFLTRNSPRQDGAASGNSAKQLTSRETEVARLLAEGWSRPSVAKLLGVTNFTIVTMSSRIDKKLGVRSRAQLALALTGASPAPLPLQSEAKQAAQE